MLILRPLRGFILLLYFLRRAWPDVTIYKAYGLSSSYIVSRTLINSLMTTFYKSSIIWYWCSCHEYLGCKNAWGSQREVL